MGARNGVQSRLMRPTDVVHVGAEDHGHAIIRPLAFPDLDIGTYSPQSYISVNTTYLIDTQHN